MYKNCFNMTVPCSHFKNTNYFFYKNKKVFYLTVNLATFWYNYIFLTISKQKKIDLYTIEIYCIILNEMIIFQIK